MGIFSAGSPSKAVQSNCGLSMVFEGILQWCNRCTIIINRLVYFFYNYTIVR